MLNITNDMITVGDNSYPTKNIASVQIKENNLLFRSPIRILIYLAGMFAYGYLILVLPFYVSYKYSVYSPITWWFMTLVGTIVFTVYTVRKLYKRFPEKTRRDYTLHMMTNAGATQLITSTDKPFIEKVKKHVVQALENSNPVSYTVNVDKMTIENNVDNSTTVNGDIISNYDFSINYTQYPNLDDIAQQFLNTKFEDSLKSMMQDALKANNTQLQTEITNLVNAINQPEPNPAVLEAATQRVERVSNLYGVGKNVLEVVTLGTSVLSAGIALVA